MGTESNLARFIAFLESGKVEGYGYLDSGTQSQLVDVIDTYAEITEYIQDQQTLGKLRLCGMPQDHVKRRRPGAGWKFEKLATSLHSMHATQKKDNNQDEESGIPHASVDGWSFTAGTNGGSEAAIPTLTATCRDASRANNV